MKTVQPHDLITHDDIRELADVELATCVSLHLPTYRAAPDSHQNPVRLKNMLEEAEAIYAERNLRRADIQQLLQPARELINDALYWTHQSDGLSLFFGENFVRKFRLPAATDESIEISRQFLITPLISTLRPGKTFYVLAVSQNSCRLLRGTQFQAESVELDDMPQNLQDALGWWRERNLNFHAYRNVRTDRAMFHGHDENVKEIDVTEYLRRVTDALHPLVNEYEASLVFAGVEELFPIFQEVSQSRNLVEEFVKGNPDRLSDAELHQKAWPIIDRQLQRQAEDVQTIYHKRRKQDHASDDLSLIVPASRTGLVETLFISANERHKGRFDRDNNVLELNGTSHVDEDILNLAAVFTLRTGGNVLAVTREQLPSDSPAAAILRVPTSAVGTAEAR